MCSPNNVTFVNASASDSITLSEDSCVITLLRVMSLNPISKLVDDVL